MATENDTPEVETNEESNPHLESFARSCAAMASADMSEEDYRRHMDEAVIHGMDMLKQGDPVKILALKQLIDVGIKCASKGSWTGPLNAYVECDVNGRKGQVTRMCMRLERRR